MGGGAWRIGARLLRMSRAFLMVMDSFGIGGAPDAEAYGDAGSSTYGHILAACADGRGDRAGLRAGPLCVPNLDRLGLGFAAGRATSGEALGQWGAARERSLGKDTPSGHWEIAGVPVTFAWGYFPETMPCFPKSLTDDLIARCQLSGLLGNKHASGTEIIAELGAEHMRTGKAHRLHLRRQCAADRGPRGHVRPRSPL